MEEKQVRRERKEQILVFFSKSVKKENEFLLVF